MSFKVEFVIRGDDHAISNRDRFKFHEEAHAAGMRLWRRWNIFQSMSIVESDDPVNCELDWPPEEIEITFEQAKELFGELPTDVQEDPYFRKEFLDLCSGLVENEGEELVKEHRVMLLSQWEYVRTLV